MLEWFMGLAVWQQALLAGSIAWAFTAAGAGLVFFFKEIKSWVYAILLGFAAGIMVAASFWGLLEPALEHADSHRMPAWLIVTIGFLVGGIVLYIADKAIPHLHLGSKEVAEGPPTKFKRSILFVFSMLLHNIPEGIALGVAFGSIYRGDVATATVATISAISLSLAIGIHNFPEGAAVALTLKQENVSSTKAFMYGQASAIVEPIGALIGALLVASIENIMPYALAFAAGAMIYVVVEEIIPEAQETIKKGTHLAVLGFFIGFIVMMILDNALG